MNEDVDALRKQRHADLLAEKFRVQQQAKMDQEVKSVCDSLPQLLWGMYQALMKTGFPKDQAFALTQTYLLSFAPGGINGCNPCLPKEMEDDSAGSQ